MVLSRIHIGRDSSGEKIVVVRTGDKVRTGRSCSAKSFRVVQGEPLEGGATVWIETKERIRVTK